MGNFSFVGMPGRKSLPPRGGSVIFALFLFVFLSCKSSASQVETPPQEAGDRGFWSTEPFFNEVIFHGAAGVRVDREESIRLALEDAARKAALFTRTEGKTIFYNKTGAGFWDYRSDTESILIYDEDYQKYIENFIFDSELDVLQDNNAIFVRTRYPSAGPVDIPYRFRSSRSAGKPGWIDEPPLIRGYVAGIGYAGRRSSHADTVKISYENAAFAIIRNIYSTVTGNTADIQGPGASASQESEITAEAVLTGFYVLDFWVDPSSRAVWTLAVAKPGT
jgi:hypothetical protein